MSELPVWLLAGLPFGPLAAVVALALVALGQPGARLDGVRGRPGRTVKEMTGLRAELSLLREMRTPGSGRARR